jgi:hypothetical protein
MIVKNLSFQKTVVKSYKYVCIVSYKHLKLQIFVNQYL